MTAADASAAAPADRRVDDAQRHRERTAHLRCAAYAACSELLSSPHEVDVCDALRQRLGAGAELGYGAALDALVAEYLDRDRAGLRREYSGLFEVGSDGPPVPIREDLQTGQRAGTREDLVRFYDYFGYALAERFAWQPDHLSVELEFMHYLCYCEAAAVDDAQSFQLAQLDFAVRHLGNWLGPLAEQAGGLAPDSLYARGLATLADFVAADLAWQRSTLAGPAAD